MNFNHRVAPLLALALSFTGVAQAQLRASVDDVFRAADVDGDGLVSRAEFRAAREQQFSRLDRDGDGYFGDSDVPKRLLQRSGASRVTALIAQFDKNADRRISRTEFVEGPTTVFDLVDVNEDGRVDKREVDAARERIRALREDPQDP